MAETFPQGERTAGMPAGNLRCVSPQTPGKKQYFIGSGFAEFTLSDGENRPAKPLPNRDFYNGSVRPIPFTFAISTILMAVGISSRAMPMFTAQTFSSLELRPSAFPANTLQISGRLSGP